MNNYEKIFRKSENNFSIDFNCNNENLTRDYNILYVEVDGACMSLDKDQMIELRDHLNKMIEVKASVDKSKVLKALEARKKRLMLSLDELEEEISHERLEIRDWKVPIILL